MSTRIKGARALGCALVKPLSGLVGAHLVKQTKAQQANLLADYHDDERTGYKLNK